MAKILLVDDQEILLELAEIQLGKDHHVTSTLIGSEALQMLQEQDFKVVLTDFELEQSINGVDIAQAAVRKGIIAVIYSGNPQKIKLPDELIGKVTILKKPIRDINVEINHIMSRNEET